MSNPLFIDFSNDTISSSGAAFSSDSRFLYISASKRVYQFDMLASDISASREVVAEYDGFLAEFDLSTKFYQQMLAPNGKIYITAPNSVRYLHVINEPSKKGTECNLEQHGLALPTLHAFSTPNFPHYRLGPSDGSVCDSLGIDNRPVAKFRYGQNGQNPLQIDFTDLSYYEPNVWDWDFGDGAHAQGRDQVHVYETPGSYQVCLQVSNVNTSDITCQWIDVNTTGAFSIESASTRLVVYPNPFEDFIEIRSTAPDISTYDVLIYNIYGMIIRHFENLELPVHILTNAFLPGVYICTLTSREKLTTSIVILKL